MKFSLVIVIVYIVSIIPGCNNVHNRISHRLKVNPNTPSPIQMHYIPANQHQGTLKAIMEMGQCTYFPSQIEEIQETPLNKLNATNQIVNNTQLKRCFMSSQNYIDPSLNSPQQLQSLISCNKQRKRLVHGQYNLECMHYSQNGRPKYKIMFNQNSYRIDLKEKEIMQSVQPSVKDWVRFIVRFYDNKDDDDDDDQQFVCNDLKYVKHYRCQWKKKILHNQTDNSASADFSKLISQYISSHDVNVTNHTADQQTTLNQNNTVSSYDSSKFINLKTKIDSLQKQKPIRDYRYQLKVNSIIENIKDLIAEKQKKLNMIKYFQRKQIEKQQKIQAIKNQKQVDNDNRNKTSSMNLQHQKVEKKQSDKVDMDGKQKQNEKQ